VIDFVSGKKRNALNAPPLRALCTQIPSTRIAKDLLDPQGRGAVVAAQESSVLIRAPFVSGFAVGTHLGLHNMPQVYLYKDKKYAK
jgi:hypothetical protein